ncbi:MAG: methyltransferase domain-containing protein [Acidobacteria bacterium]|nr:methyltransferase domain-containing protein [Acidobacteriota bacterium]
MKELPEGFWLNIGCGPSNPSGWVNLDGSWQARLAGNGIASWLACRLTGRDAGNWPSGIIHRDIRKGLGYAPGTVAVVYSSHTLEHLFREEAVSLMRDVYRALKPGGVCRIVVPDLRAIIDWYLEHANLPASQKALPSSDLLMGMLSVHSRSNPANTKGVWGWYRRLTNFEEHKWMYDEEGLENIFLEAGFSQPVAKNYLDSLIPVDRLQVVEKEDRLANGAGICVEARK